METIDDAIDVNADIRTVYNQWTQFEDFPEFMEGIEEVQQRDDTHLHWVAKVAGRQHEWDAEIYEQIPDQMIAWRSISGKKNDGEVKFEKIADNQTRVSVQFIYEPEGLIEKAGNAVGLLRSRIQGDLKRFKEFVESRGHETGAWRGEIHQGRVRERTPGALGQTRSERLGHNETP